MQDSLILAASTTLLGLTGAIYYVHHHARPGSWLKSELVSMVLLSVAVGIAPLAMFGPFVGLADTFAGGITASGFATAGMDLLSLALTAAAFLVYRALVRDAAKTWHGPANVTPFTPRPAGPRTPPASGQKMKKAA